MPQKFVADDSALVQGIAWCVQQPATSKTNVDQNLDAIIPNELMLHDDVIKFSALLAICAGNSPVNGEFPAQRPVTRSFDVFCVWINGWVNNREAGDLRRYRVHCDVIVMEHHSPSSNSMTAWLIVKLICVPEGGWFDAICWCISLLVF